MKILTSLTFHWNQSEYFVNVKEYQYIRDYMQIIIIIDVRF